MNLDDVLALLSQKEVLIALSSALFLLIAVLVFRRLRLSGHLKKLKELEIRYNSIKSVPLQFKLNKAIALSRVNHEISGLTQACREDFAKIYENFKSLAVLLADTEDELLIGKVKTAKENLEDLSGLIDSEQKRVEQLEGRLNAILERENQQRYEITRLKDEFREVKSQIAAKAASLNFSIETIEHEVFEIEKMFTAFEEWMFASEFEKAESKSSEINESLAVLKNQIDTLPELISLAKGLLPRLLDDVAFNYSRIKQKGVFLNHLEISKNLDMISATLKEDLTALRQGLSDRAKEHCDENQKRLQQLLVAMEREDKAYDEIAVINNELAKASVENANLFTEVRKSVEMVAIRFGFNQLNTSLPKIEKEMMSSMETYRKLERMSREKSIPASTLLITFKENQQDMANQAKDIQLIKDQVLRASSDEERAKKQLLKLHLIMNEIEVKIHRHRLPQISENYQGDVVRCHQYIESIEELLSVNPLDIKSLNLTVSEGIDYIYKLYNNVNNIVGMVDMVEHAIVFGNKYRSSFPNIDSELTRAELSFRNGEYTQALTIALSAIEKLHPNQFEDLIKENARSAKHT
ncbi:MAG: septation ring formation regulator EzrA [Erysipelotrichaceae bacterium]|nr:septation ring formation regulator EzrA [Erysipelotrichaceae bacterium]MDP3306152.1 septation ring formation regulator EzrA [Erysipelotrichaceae bacterium]